MSSKRSQPYLCVYLLFRRGDEIVFQLRQNTGYADGFYSLPAGHVDHGENMIQAAIREAKEEVGVSIHKQDLQLVHTMHRVHERENLDLFFSVLRWEGEITNCEPHKCGGLLFCPMQKPPKETVSYVVHALQCISQHIPFSEVGW